MGPGTSAQLLLPEILIIHRSIQVADNFVGTASACTSEVEVVLDPMAKPVRYFEDSTCNDFAGPCEFASAAVAAAASVARSLAPSVARSLAPAISSSRSLAPAVIRSVGHVAAAFCHSRSK